MGCSNVTVNGYSGGAVDGSADGQVGGSCGGMADDSSSRAEDTSADGYDAATGGSSGSTAGSVATSPRLLSDGDVGDVMEFRDLFQQLGYTPGDQNWQTPEDWLEEDSENPGCQLMTDNEIVSEINGKQLLILRLRMMNWTQVQCQIQKLVKHLTWH